MNDNIIKTCLITGANSGIGYETAKALAKMGYHIIMVCRNAERGETARQQIIGDTGNQLVELLIADLSSHQDIQNLANEITKRYAQLDVLINNAGGIFYDKQRNNAGHEMTLAVNYLAVFDLTQTLLPLLKAAPQGRIVIVSSELEKLGRIDWGDIEFLKRPYNLIAAYAQSKLMTIIYTKELAKRLADTHITVNAVHPGGVTTGLGLRDNNLLYRLVWRLAGLFMISAEKGAETSVYLATSPDVAGISGRFWSNKKFRKNNPRADEPGVGEKLWKWTEAALGER